MRTRRRVGSSPAPLLTGREDYRKKTLTKNTNLPATSLKGGGGQQELPWKKLEAIRIKTVVEETFLLELLFTSKGSATSCR